MKSKINVSHYEDNELPLTLSLPLLSPPPPPSVQVISPWKVENKKGNAIRKPSAKVTRIRTRTRTPPKTVRWWFNLPAHVIRTGNIISREIFHGPSTRPLVAVTAAAAICSREIFARGPLLPLPSPSVPERSPRAAPCCLQRSCYRCLGGRL
jgi:hypothetical protein